MHRSCCVVSVSRGVNDVRISWLLELAHQTHHDADGEPSTGDRTDDLPVAGPLASGRVRGSETPTSS